MSNVGGIGRKFRSVNGHDSQGRSVNRVHSPVRNKYSFRLRGETQNANQISSLAAALGCSPPGAVRELDEGQGRRCFYQHGRREHGCKHKISLSSIKPDE